MLKNIRELAKHHKKYCDKDCGVSLLGVGMAYEKIKGKSLTKKELEVFS